MPAATLRSQTAENRRQTALTALAVGQAIRLAPRGAVTVARSVQQYQAAAAEVSMETLGALLAEQGISAAADAAPSPSALLTSVQGLSGMLNQADSQGGFVRLVQTMVQDARRTARVTDAATRPAVTGWTRRITTPCCGRCAVLAGRVYRYSEGFLRHPQCDCDPTPTDLSTGRELVTDPSELVDRGLITDLSGADRKALDAGADLGRVVNVRRRKAGLTYGSSVMQRAGSLTPQGCITLASDRSEMLRLLRQFGYVR